MAYIDPNTGGMLFQALLAAFAVISGFLLLFSRRIRIVLSRARRHLRDLRHGDGPNDQDEEA